jgi:hypothetical protein
MNNEHRMLNDEGTGASKNFIIRYSVLDIRYFKNNNEYRMLNDKGTGASKNFIIRYSVLAIRYSKK